MKMAQSRFRKLEQMGLRVMDKPMPTDNPRNRDERRLKAKLDRKRRADHPAPASVTE